MSKLVQLSKCPMIEVRGDGHVLSHHFREYGHWHCHDLFTVRTSPQLPGVMVENKSQAHEIPEILAIVFEHVRRAKDERTLCHASLVNRVFRVEAQRVLWMEIELKSPLQLVRCARIIRAEPRLANIVRAFRITNLRGDPYKLPLLPTISRLIRRTLYVMPRLEMLDILDPFLVHFGETLPIEAPFQLHTLKCCFRWSKYIERFLASQPGIRFLNFPTAPSVGRYSVPPPSLLPKIEEVESTVLGLPLFVLGRSIKVATISYPALNMEMWGHLAPAVTKIPALRIPVRNVDCELMARIGEDCKELYSLEIVSPALDRRGLRYPAAQEEVIRMKSPEFCASIGEFRCLAKLSIWIVQRTDDWRVLAEDMPDVDVIHKWHSNCPSLREITMVVASSSDRIPLTHTWSYISGNWQLAHTGDSQ